MCFDFEFDQKPVWWKAHNLDDNLTFMIEHYSLLKELPWGIHDK